MESLAEIARETFAQTADFQAVADAVIAEYEARRWKPWPPCVDGELPDVVALDDPEGERRVAYLLNGKWFDESGEVISEYVHPPRCWTPIPAPPKEASDAE